MKLRAAALAGAILLGASAWPALGHSGNDRRPGAAQFDLEVKINGDAEPGYDPNVVADKFGNLYVAARKQHPAAKDDRARANARASSWRWTSKDGGATWAPLPGEAEAAAAGTTSDAAVDPTGKVYVYDAPSLLRWTATGLGKVTFDGAAPVPGVSPVADPVLVAPGGGRVLLLAGTTLHTSTDGGVTFGPVGYAFPGATECRLAARGNAAYATCLDGAGEVHVHSSRDGGRTFERRTLATYDPDAPLVDVPPVAVTPGGVAYVLRSETETQTTLYLMRTADGGRTWTERRASDDKVYATHLSLTAAPDGRLGAAMYIEGPQGWFVAAGIFGTEAPLLIVNFADHTPVSGQGAPPPEGSPGVSFLPESRLAVTWTIVDETVPDSTTPLLQDVWFVRSQPAERKSETPNLARTPHYEIPPCTVQGQVTRRADWQAIKAPAFRARSGGAGPALVAYAVDPYDPRVVYATNGTTLARSDDGGCRWREVWSLEPSPTEEMPLSSATARVVALAVPEDRREHTTVFAVINEVGEDGSGRPRVLRSPSGEPGTFVLRDSGLPPAGAPGLFRVSGGNPDFLYLTVGNHLYASNDAGATWALRTPVTEVATAPVITALALDPKSPINLYAVWSGTLHHSRDAGRTWDAPVPSAALQSAAGTITAVDVFHADAEAPQPVAWSAPGGSKPASVLRSPDDGVTWTRETAAGLSGPVESAVHGSRADVLVVSTLPVNDGKATVAALDRKTGTYVDLSPVATSAPFRVQADRRGHPTFYGMSAQAIFRYAGDEIEPPAAPEDRDDSVFADIDPAAPPPVVSPARQDVSLLVGTKKTVPFDIDLAARRPRVDVVLLSDTSESMTGHLPALRADLLRSLRRLARDADVWVGVAQAKTDAAPPAYRRERDVGPLGDAVAAALGRLDPRNGSGLETQLIGLDQIVTGKGMDACPAVGAIGQRPGACLDPPVGSVCEVQPESAGCAVRPGQQMSFRDDALRVVVHATDTTFRNPEGTPRGRDGRIDIAGVARKYRHDDVLHVGVAVDPEGVPDLAEMSALTETVAPAGGLSCGSVRVAAGRPVVCPSAAGLDGVLSALLRAHAHPTHVHVAPQGKAAAAFVSVTPHELDGIVLTEAHHVTARVTVSCAGRAPGHYDVVLAATVHDEAPVPFRVGVDCVLPEPSARGSRPLGGIPPLLPPPPPAPAPVPQPPVNVNPNVQTQVQAQVQPQAGAATQEHEELEVAYAENDRDLGVPAELVVLAGALGMSAGALMAAQRSRTSTAPARAR